MMRTAKREFDLVVYGAASFVGRILCRYLVDRYGVGGDVEVFLAGIRWIDADFGSTSASGLGDIGIGTKIALPDYGDRFKSALLFVVSAPTGSANLTTDRWDPSLGYVWSYSGRIPLAGTARIFDLGEGTTFANGLKLPVQLDEQRSVFVEWEANIRENGSNSHWVNTGFQMLLSDDIQVDVAVDFSLTEFGDDFRIAFGFSAR